LFFFFSRFGGGGGFVRDLLLGRAADPDRRHRPGDRGGRHRLRRRLAEEMGGHLVVHRAFGTASLEGGATPDGTRVGRVDIGHGQTRSDTYDRARFPRLSPAGIDDDLKRRDFSVNAMAVSLSPSAWGRLHDRSGARMTWPRGGLRVLHPLSLRRGSHAYLEGRSVRGGGFASAQTPVSSERSLWPSRWERIPPFPGSVLHAEHALVMDEAEPWRALGLLLGWAPSGCGTPRIASRPTAGPGSLRPVFSCAGHVARESPSIARSWRSSPCSSISRGPSLIGACAGSPWRAVRRPGSTRARPATGATSRLGGPAATESRGGSAPAGSGGAGVRGLAGGGASGAPSHRVVSSARAGPGGRSRRGRRGGGGRAARAASLGQALAHLRDLSLDGRVRTIRGGARGGCRMDEGHGDEKEISGDARNSSS